MCAEYGIELLTVSVLLVPPRLALCRHVGTDGQRAQHAAQVEAVVGSSRQRVFGNEGHALVLVVDGYGLAAHGGAVHVVLEDGAGVAVADHPVEVVVQRTAAQRGLHAAAIALAGVHHGTSEAVLAGKNRQLLVAYLHVVAREVEMRGTAKEVQMGTELKVPRLFGLVADGVADVLVGSLVVRQLHVTASPLGSTLQLGLEDVAEHLEVEASSPVAFRYDGIDVAARLVEPIGQSHLGQQLVERRIILVG